MGVGFIAARLQEDAGPEGVLGRETRRALRGWGTALGVFTQVRRSSTWLDSRESLGVGMFRWWPSGDEAQALAERLRVDGLAARE